MKGLNEYISKLSDSEKTEMLKFLIGCAEEAGELYWNYDKKKILFRDGSELINEINGK